MHQQMRCAALAALMSLATAASTSTQEAVTRDDADRRAESRIAELKDKAMRGRATAALLRLGSRAVPALRRALRPRGEGLRGRFDPDVLAVLARMGPDAADAADDLSDLLERVAPADVPEVMHAVANVAPHAKGWTQTYMDRMHRLTRRNIEATRDGKIALAIRRQFVRLSIRAHVAKRNTKSLLATMKSNAAVAREIAAEVLGREATRTAIAPLQECLRAGKPPRLTKQYAFGQSFSIDEDGYHATAATALLKIVGTRSEDAIPALAHRLSHGTLLERQQAALDLGALEGKAASAVPLLMKVARQADPRVTAEAITALGRIGRAARAAESTLVELSKHENKQIRRRAEVALRGIRGTARRKRP